MNSFVSDATRVLVVDDDPILRDAIVSTLTGLVGFVVVGEAASLHEGLDLLHLQPDVVLIDLGLPDGSGGDLIERVATRHPGTRTIVLTVFADVRSVVDAIERGADGYVLKGSSSDEIANAVRTVMAGGSPVSPAVASHILARVRRAPRSMNTPLTAKETEVLEALAVGRSTKEVARLQGISIHTVGDHVKAIYRKLSVNSRSEAVYKATQAGLISTPR